MTVNGGVWIDHRKAVIVALAGISDCFFGHCTNATLSSIPEFRRETLRLLNHNERTHTLQRQIRRAGTTSRRGRRAEELAAQSGALALVTNLVIAWNTHALQATLSRWHSELGKKIDRATLRHITPMGFEHVNFNGVLIIPLDRFRSRLLPSSTTPVRPISAAG